MATNRIPITFTAIEKRKLEGRAKKLGLSFSNYVRQLLGLPPMKHGDPRRFKRKAAEQPTTEEQHGHKRSTKHS